MSVAVSLLLDHLASAYGGHSQYSLKAVGEAIAGQKNNNGWPLSAAVYAADAAGVLAIRWQDNREAEDAAEILAACEKQLAEFSQPAEFSQARRGYGSGR